MFEQYDINDFTTEQLLNFGLKEVPGFIIVNKNGQSQCVEGPKAFDWINKMVLNRRQHMAVQANTNRLRILEKNMQLNKENGVADYCQEEMSGMSDGYAYLLTDMPQSKSYVGLGLKDHAIVTLQTQKNKLQKNDTDKAMKDAEAMRKHQDAVLNKEMKEGQLLAIYNHKYQGK